MKLIDTKDAVGHVLCHDITQIIVGQTKGPVFKKGHVVREEDIPVLMSVGKEHLYVWERDESMLHEDEAAEVLREICQGEGLKATEASEGKVELIAETDGLLKIDRSCLYALNALGEIVVASRHGDTVVHAGDKVAGMRVIPLVIAKEKMDQAREAVSGSAGFSVRPFTHKKVGVVTTGSEVLNGLIEDSFTPVLRDKLVEYDTEVIGQVKTGDDRERIVSAINGFLAEGADLVVCTGGMSVDPDDRTPAAIREATVDVVTYGAPVLPGAMFMLAYTASCVPVLGLPGCVMYSKRTIFDLVMPRLMADERLRAEDFYCLGEGGLCLHCNPCTYPNCGFGKGRVL